MKLKIPLTGTAIKHTDGNWVGDPNDPVRIFLDIGDIAWQAVSFDWENGMVEVEVTEVPRHDLIKLPGKVARYEKDLTQAEIDSMQSGKVVPQMIAETDSQYNTRKAAVLANAQVLLSKPKEELYAMSGSLPLKVSPVQIVEV
jgi:hypothetical protein